MPTDALNSLYHAGGSWVPRQDELAAHAEYAKANAPPTASRPSQLEALAELHRERRATAETDARKPMGPPEEKHCLHDTAGISIVSTHFASDSSFDHESSQPPSLLMTSIGAKSIRRATCDGPGAKTRRLPSPRSVTRSSARSAQRAVTAPSRFSLRQYTSSLASWQPAIARSCARRIVVVYAAPIYDLL
jgi:hypothetical protein